ncbi:hypothetical protein GWI33_011736, partial [Rhynchophorus ferrugineus]
MKKLPAIFTSSQPANWSHSAAEADGDALATYPKNFPSSVRVPWPGLVQSRVRTKSSKRRYGSVPMFGQLEILPFLVFEYWVSKVS